MFIKLKVGAGADARGILGRLEQPDIGGGSEGKPEANKLPVHGAATSPDDEYERPPSSTERHAEVAAVSRAGRETATGASRERNTVYGHGGVVLPARR